MKFANVSGESQFESSNLSAEKQRDPSSAKSWQPALSGSILTPGRLSGSARDRGAIGITIPCDPTLKLQSLCVEPSFDAFSVERGPKLEWKVVGCHALVERTNYLLEVVQEHVGLLDAKATTVTR